MNGKEGTKDARSKDKVKEKEVVREKAKEKDKDKSDKPKAREREETKEAKAKDVKESKEKAPSVFFFVKTVSNYFVRAFTTVSDCDDLPLICFDLLFRIVISSGCKDRKRDKRSQEEECVRRVSACFKHCDTRVSASLALNRQTEFGNLLFCSIPRWSVGEGRRGGAKKKRRQQQEPFSTCRGHGHGFQILQHHWVKRSETEYIIIARGKKQGEPKRGAESAWSLTGLTLVAFLCLKLGRSSCGEGDGERERELWCDVKLIPIFPAFTWP